MKIDQYCKTCMYVCKNKWREGQEKVGPLCWYLTKKNLKTEVSANEPR